MDNIIIEKIYEDTDLMEIKINVISKFVTAHQHCYTYSEGLETHSDEIISYSKKIQEDYYAEFGEKEGNYTPAFSLKFLKAEANGHLKIEVDLEIDDNEERKHRCSCYIKTDLGSVERFGNALRSLATSDVGVEIRLHD